ncbi:MAG: hypothetical protein CR984_02450 [Proteobacteria bacterium]|nr:MAG: hypothetical protein CR984_02450 [Pseudomonadota bacterium]PIE67593.1 MAG: hypothetical protein CSA23_03175 [Deltaproteobacteria bacterium]
MEVDGDKTFYTETMARVYADQGRYEQAATIYRYLLDQTPDRADLQQALENVCRYLPDTPPQWYAVSLTIQRWVRMIMRQKSLRDHRRTAIKFDESVKNTIME